MNHDFTHCLDQDKDCPKDCFRAMLNEDYNAHRIDFMHQPIFWAHMRGFMGCPLEKLEENK